MLIACPRQQWLLDSASLLYVHCLSHSVLKPSRLSQLLVAVFENVRNDWLIFSSVLYMVSIIDLIPFFVFFSEKWITMWILI